MKKFLIFFTLFLILVFSSQVLAETKTFVKEYTYQASEDDSRNSSRTISLREVKRLLLEELGTYLESETEVRNFQLMKDQITILTAGIVKTEIVDEKWDGRTYWLRARIVADSDGVIKAINTLRQDRQKTKELEDVRRRSDELLRENVRLRQEMAAAKGERNEKDKAAYDETIKALTATEWFEKGYASTMSESYSDAIGAFSKAIELSPRMANAYLNRGTNYFLVGKHSQAIEDFDRVIEIDPKYAMAYFNRGIAYSNLGNQQQAIRDYGRAIELNPKYAEAYHNRGSIHDRLGDYKRAVEDFDKAIELNPKMAVAYVGRGYSYFKLAYHNRGTTNDKVGNYKRAVENFNKAIELDSKMAVAYFGRAAAYGSLSNHKQATEDFKTAARLGHNEAQSILRKEGINW